MKEDQAKHRGQHQHWRGARRGPRRGLGFWLLSAAAVMFLWNALVPDLFQGPHIGYLQALGLTILATLLTGGFPGPRGGHGCHKGGANMRQHFRKKFREKMAGMGEEERRRFKEAFGAGRWDVNVIEVEDEEEETDERPDDHPADAKG